MYLEQCHFKREKNVYDNIFSRMHSLYNNCNIIKIITMLTLKTAVKITLYYYNVM
jgi:hypothetical protein